MLLFQMPLMSQSEALDAGEITLIHHEAGTVVSNEFP